MFDKIDYLYFFFMSVSSCVLGVGGEGGCGVVSNRVGEMNGK